MPEGILVGPAYETIGYLATGEASDWFTAAFDLPAASPELGTSDPASRQFKLDSIDMVYEIVYQHYDYVDTTYDKIGDEIWLTGLQYLDNTD